MTRKIIVREEALFDVIDVAYHIAEGNMQAADRFAEAIGDAYQRIAAMPGIGTLRRFDNPRFAGMRMCLVPGFRNYLIFYLTTDDAVEIIRVLHGARDIESIFTSEEVPDTDNDPPAQ